MIDERERYVRWRVSTEAGVVTSVPDCGDVGQRYNFGIEFPLVHASQYGKPKKQSARVDSGSSPRSTERRC